MLESDSGQAQDLIASMGRAFQLRYNSSFIKTQDCMDNLNTDKDYYNDLPDKLPPDLLEEPLSEPTPKIDIAVCNNLRFRKFFFLLFHYYVNTVFITLYLT